MSFGDSKTSPINGFVGGMMTKFDSVFGTIGGRSATDTPAPQVPKSLITAPTPESIDTPGRHKTLLGQ